MGIKNHSTQIESDNKEHSSRNDTIGNDHVNTDNDPNNGDYNDSLLLEELEADGDSEEDGNKGPEERNIQQGGGRVPKNLKYFLGGYWCINYDNDNNIYAISVVS